jgi:hypothetical protein
MLGCLVVPAAGEVLVNKDSGKVLDVAPSDTSKNGTQARLWDRNNQPHQRWQIVALPDQGFVKIVSLPHGLVLDAEAADVKKKGCRVILWQWNGKPHQQWRMQKVGEYYKFFNRASGLVLDANGTDGTDKNGCRVHLWEDENAPNHMWKLVK